MDKKNFPGASLFAAPSKYEFRSNGPNIDTCKQTKYPETMQIGGGGIAPKEPRNISLITFHAREYYDRNFTLFGHKKTTFVNVMTQKYWTCLPRVCTSLG